MRRDQLEHAIRAATEIIHADAILIIGSQAVLGSYPDDQLPAEATASVEVDMAPLGDDDAGTLATLLDGAIGELSPFHHTHGFYVQGVGTSTAILPDGWQHRLVAVTGPNTHGRTGLCLDIHDLCLAKLAAARGKDHRFVHALLTAGLISPDVLADRVEQMTTADPRTRNAIRGWITTNRRRPHR